MARSNFPLAGFVALLGACDRLDALAIIDSPGHNAVIIDNVDSNGGRVICVRSDVTKSCSRRTAEVIVSSNGKPADIQLGWADNDRVAITVVEGRLEKFAPTALDGRVRIDYRR